jgi:radical SAM-linked protein
VGGIQLIVRVKFTKLGYLKYLSHLDLVRLFTRSFSRAELPIKYTEGFNPHPKFSIGNPLSLGVESLAEYMELELEEELEPTEVMDRLNRVLPEGIELVAAQKSNGEYSLSSIMKWSLYEIRLWLGSEEKKTRLDEILISWDKLDHVLIEKKRKKGKNKIIVEKDILPLIGKLSFAGVDEDGFVVLNALLKTGEEGNLKPIELAEAMNRELQLEADLDMTHIKRLEAFIEIDGSLSNPL